MPSVGSHTPPKKTNVKTDSKAPVKQATLKTKNEKKVKNASSVPPESTTALKRVQLRSDHLKGRN